LRGRQFRRPRAFLTGDRMDINLLESTTFTLTIKCRLPGASADSWRDFQFKATFKAMPQDDWEDLIEDARKSEALREVLVDVEGIPAGKLDDGTELSPVEVAVKNPFTCDAAFTAYALYVNQNGRDQTEAVSRKNSKRSRRR
jgi:hypothetical protein